MIEALVRLSVELPKRVSIYKLGDGAGRFIPRDPRHVAAEMIRAVIPLVVRAMCKEKVVHCTTVEAMPECVNEVLAIRHQYYMVVRPTKVQVGSWISYLVEFDADLLVDERSVGKLFESVMFPVCPCPLELALHREPPPNQERDNEQGYRSEKQDLAAWSTIPSHKVFRCWRESPGYARWPMTSR